MSAVATSADLQRTMALSCPGWPLTAAGLDSVPAAILEANRVVVASPAARAQGVRRGQRRREAQRHCSSLTMAEADPARDAREFEPVLGTLGEFVARFEIVEPGLCVFAAKGPARYFGGEDRLCSRLRAAVVQAKTPGKVDARVGVADGIFAARRASAAGEHGIVVADGQTPKFLAPQPVGVLGRDELCDLLVRLGLHTLGDFAALPAESVRDRFGTDGLAAHRLASGRDTRLLVACDPPPELSCATEIDPPADRAETAAFSARALASEFVARLHALGSICTSLAIVAESDHGEECLRIWRNDDGLDEAAVVDRVRWQLEGWTASSNRPTAGIAMLRFVPEQVRHDTGRQLGFWGGSSEHDERAARGFARVQGMLGSDAVQTAVPAGGRNPNDWVRLVPWGGSRPGVPPEPKPSERRVWPGRIPRPAPSVVHDPPRPAFVVALGGEPVRVGADGGLLGEPAELSLDGRSFRGVVSWSAPWPLDERWWDSSGHDRRVRMQVVTADGTAHLLSYSAAGAWALDATYD